MTKGLVKSLSKEKILSKVNLHINVEIFTVTFIISKRGPAQPLAVKGTLLNSEH